jgi:hypothetical protein
LVESQKQRDNYGQRKKWKNSVSLAWKAFQTHSQVVEVIEASIERKVRVVVVVERSG